MKKRATFQEQCHALNVLISKGVEVSANIKGTMQRIESIKDDPTTGFTALFHDEQGNLCMFKADPSTNEIEFLVKLERRAVG